MPYVGARAFPPLVFNGWSSAAGRANDTCSHCGCTTFPMRGWAEQDGTSCDCTCQPHPWSQADVSLHREYLDAVAAWEDNPDTSDDYIECNCPTCQGRSSTVSDTAQSALMQMHASYRAEVRRQIQNERAAQQHHSGNPCKAHKWNRVCTQRGRPRLGFEFECDAQTLSAQEAVVSKTQAAWDKSGLRHAKGYLIQKSDGSVRGERPIEYATVPCTLLEHEKILWSAFPEGRFGGGRLRSWPASVNAGMHVHIGRVCVSPLLAGKMAVFLQHPLNDAWMTTLCGRNGGDYCHRLPAAVREGTHGRGERYVALNKIPPSTFEYRIFRPSSITTSVLKNLEFCEALPEFLKFAPLCATTADDLGQHGWQGFMQWLAQPAVRKKYFHLHYWWLGNTTQFGEYYRTRLPKNVVFVGRHRRRGFEEFARANSAGEV